LVAHDLPRPPGCPNQARRLRTAEPHTPPGRFFRQHDGNDFGAQTFKTMVVDGGAQFFKLASCCRFANKAWRVPFKRANRLLRPPCHIFATTAAVHIRKHER
jgi:hypothetical protein